MIVAFSGEAEVDLEEIADHIARNNPRRALSFIRELRSKCAELATVPNAFTLVPRYERHNIRWCVHGNYLIFYRVEGDRIVIIHLPNGATDHGAALFED